MIYTGNNRYESMYVLKTLAKYGIKHKFGGIKKSDLKGDKERLVAWNIGGIPEFIDFLDGNNKLLKKCLKIASTKWLYFVIIIPTTENIDEYKLLCLIGTYKQIMYSRLTTQYDIHWFFCHPDKIADELLKLKGALND